MWCQETSLWKARKPNDNAEKLYKEWWEYTKGKNGQFHNYAKDPDLM